MGGSDSDVELPSGEEGQPPLCGEEEDDHDYPSKKGTVKPKSKAGRPKGPSKSKGPKLEKATKQHGVKGKNGKTRNSIVAGKKYCPGCDASHLLAEFPPGSGQCAKIRKAKQNVQKTCIASGDGAFWAEIADDWDKLRAVLQHYLATCPELQEESAKKRKPWAVAKYMEEVKRTAEISFEAIYEMMDERTFCHWNAEPRNGGVDHPASIVEWNAKCVLKGAVVDYLGTDARYKKRVAIRVKDILRMSDKESRSKGYVKMDKDMKNASDESINALEHRMNTSGFTHGESALSRSELARKLAVARAHTHDGESDEFTLGTGAFSQEGVASWTMPNIEELKKRRIRFRSRPEDTREKETSSL